MPAPAKPFLLDTDHLAQWPLPAAATLGSSVRVKGIVQDIRASLSASSRKFLDASASTLILRMPEALGETFRQARAVVERRLDGIENLPVIPREIEDILSISATERHRWLKDGRLPSAGTRTVKLRGRARAITFHVLHPRAIEDILDEDRVSGWRETDALTAAENRRRAVWKARLKRAPKPAELPGGGETEPPQLLGWAEFVRENLLR